MGRRGFIKITALVQFWKERLAGMEGGGQRTAEDGRTALVLGVAVGGASGSQ